MPAPHSCYASVTINVRTKVVNCLTLVCCVLAALRSFGIVEWGWGWTLAPLMIWWAMVGLVGTVWSLGYAWLARSERR